MPFADYGSFEECVEENSDKQDASAYCAQIHHNATGEWPGDTKAEDHYDGPDRYLKHALEIMEETGQTPTEDKLARVRRTERKLARGE